MKCLRWGSHSLWDGIYPSTFFFLIFLWVVTQIESSVVETEEMQAETLAHPPVP